MLTNPNSSKLSQTSFELYFMELICIFILLTQKICFFFILLLKPQQINNCWCLLDPAGLTLFNMFCVCVPAYSQAGAVVGYKGLALTEQEHPGSICFFPFGFPWKTQCHQKEDFSTGRQKKFATKMVTSLTNVNFPSAEVIYSLFGTYMCIK